MLVYYSMIVDTGLKIFLGYFSITNFGLLLLAISSILLNFYDWAIIVLEYFIVMG